MLMREERSKMLPRTLLALSWLATLALADPRVARSLAGWSRRSVSELDMDTADDDLGIKLPGLIPSLGAEFSQDGVPDDGDTLNSSLIAEITREPSFTTTTEATTSTTPLSSETTANPFFPSQTTIDPQFPSQATNNPLLPSQTTTNPLLPSQTTTNPLLPSQTITDPLLPSQTITDPLLPPQTTTNLLLPCQTNTKPPLPCHTTKHPALYPEITQLPFEPVPQPSKCHSHPKISPPKPLKPRPRPCSHPAHRPCHHSNNCQKYNQHYHHTVHYPLQTLHYPIQTFHHPILTAHHPIQTVHHPMQIVPHPVQTVHHPIHAVHPRPNKFLKYKLVPLRFVPLTVSNGHFPHSGQMAPVHHPQSISYRLSKLGKARLCQPETALSKLQFCDKFH
ncbi:soluble scavenger receptor cysteine-rich domain-containing protein SSC5D-like [Penaeus vannamei]|uniref:soluble scavenger receptor cysteine-rich domain-containing protein SSC5D-like n=1 Tax=Penaeus vannamei TaxID=6689 RepID=UPI00387F4D2D